jgi:hypothetical protein
LALRKSSVCFVTQSSQFSCSDEPYRVKFVSNYYIDYIFKEFKVMTKLFRYFVLIILFSGGSYAGGTASNVTVYKSPTCGCCAGWVDYLRDNGFKVVTHNVDSLEKIKADLGLTDNRLKSCHTAVVDGYVVEGHVPVSDIQRLITEKPDIIGISAPGMPQMSPGMASIVPKDYDVLSFDKEGKIELFSSY